MSAYPETIVSLLRGRSLSLAEAGGIMTAIVDGTLGTVEVTALLTAFAMRSESSSGGASVETEDELVGFATALRERMVVVRAPAGSVDTCGTGGSGRTKLNVSTLSAFVLASLGTPVAKHGNRSTRGSGSSDVLEALGLPLDPGLVASQTLLDELGLAFLFAPAHHPALAKVAPIRNALGFRSVFNVLGPLANPAGVRRQLLGVSDARRAPFMAGALARLGTDHAVIFGGEVDELDIGQPIDAWEVRGSLVRPIRLDPAREGVRPQAAGGPLRSGVDGFHDTLDARDPVAVETIAWNAGVALAVATCGENGPLALAESVECARTALVEGTVKRFYERFRARARALEGARR